MRRHAALVEVGLAALVAVNLRLAIALEEQTVCPEGLPPYNAEPNHFGWPLTPNDWSWTASSKCWNKTQGGHVSCGGIHQSPMDLNIVADVVDGGLDPGAFRASMNYTVVSTPTVRISKHLRTAYAEGDFGFIRLKSASGEDIVYDAYEVHLTVTSLHSVNDKHHDGELLVLHRPRGHNDSLVEAVIVSAFFKHDTLSRDNLFSVFGMSADGTISDNEERNSQWTAGGDVDLTTELATVASGNFWMYNGSVPVPPCTENVKWLVFQTPLTVNPKQTTVLHELFQIWAGTTGIGNNKRPPVPRNDRVIAMNTLQVGGSHQLDSCATWSDADKARLAACWPMLEPQCAQGTQSPVPVSTSAENVKTSPTRAEKALNFVWYKTAAKDKVTVTQDMYTLTALPSSVFDAFGYIKIHGRLFPVRKISVKAVANHVVEGVRYPAELVIEHEMFGDALHDKELFPNYDPETHIVMLSVPIKLGRQNTLLRQLGLSPSSHREIEYGKSYTPSEDVNLVAALAAPLSGEWFWYNGSSTIPNCRQSVKWIVIATPIEASLDQLDFLHLRVSGLESTRIMPAVAIASAPEVYLGHLPQHAIQIEATCRGKDFFFNYLNTQCWDECSSGCSQTCASGTKQSPVNIDTSTVVKTGSDNFLHKCRWKPVGGLRIVNSGLGLVVANSQMGYVDQIGEDGFAAFFQVIQVNLHMPSEHWLNGKQYHGELQVVHAKQISNEEPDYDNMMIVSVFFDLGDVASPLLTQLLSGAKPPASGKYHYSQYPIDLMRALGPTIEGNFYSYKGSLTTPPCKEAVTWYVFETPQMMSLAQWVQFKEYYGNPSNNRPVQDMHGRLLAMNSFDTVGENKMLKQFDFYGGRDYGRNRKDPGVWWALLPVICTVILCFAVMGATFVREDVQHQHEASGGLKAASSPAHRV